MSDSITYVHKGTTIVFAQATGQFGYALNGKHQSSASLEAAKKAIDKAIASAFVAFTALTFTYAEITPVRIVAIERAGRERYHKRGQPLFISEGGQRRDRVVLDTPEARAAIERWQECARAEEAARDAYHKAQREERAAADAIPKVTPEDYRVGGAT